ncbi:MAG: hypothetical protein L6R41_006991 [Letrouitia leprolyta]|nr:MAG: hypothetical protein L6R41_006991 [Letrouitia leprolyta]
MSNNPYEKQNENNFFAGFDAFNAMNDSWFPTPPQPAFGQSWSGPGWNGMPMANHNLSSPFQSGFPLPQNDPFDQSQQSNPHEYSEDDDFYENEKGQSKNIAVDSNERRRTSVASQVNAKPTLESSMAPNQAHAATTVLQPRDGNAPLLTPGPIATNSSSNKGSDARLSELRQKLLASKRANSATPTPSSSSLTGGTVIDKAVKEPARPENTESLEANVKNKDENITAPTTTKLTNLPGNKTSSGVSNPAKSVPAQTDIQGLIDEYRAPDTATDPEKSSELTAKGDTLKSSSKPEVNKAGSETKRANKDKRRAVITNTPSKPSSGSPRSSESGEIRSDQDLVTTVTGNDHIQSSARKLEDKTSNALHDKVAVNAPHQPPAPKVQQQDDTHASKPNKVLGTTKQPPTSRAIGQRQAAKPTSDFRTAPLAQKPDQTHEEANQAPNLRALPDNHPQKPRNGDQYDNRPPRNAKVSSSFSRQSSAQAYRKAQDKVQKHQQGFENTINKEQVACPQEQFEEQHDLSSLRRADSNIIDNSSRGEKELDDKSTKTGLAFPVGLSSDKSQQNRGQEVLDSELRDHGRNILSLAQQEQIQKLGIDLSPEGLRDLYDFLEYHRFFVKEYREGFLTRQRRLRALEAEKLALERESLMQYELFNSMRAQSLAVRERTETPALVRLQDSKESIEIPLGKPMPPPLNLPRKSEGAGVIAIKGRANMVEASSPNHPASRANGTFTPRVVQYGSSLKRQHLDEDGDMYQSRKSSRMDLDGQQSDRSQQVSPRTSRSEFPGLDRRRLSEYRAADYGHRDRSRSPNHRPRSLSPYRKVPDHIRPPRQDSWAGSYTWERDQRRPSAEDFRRDLASARCHNCGRVGHLEADCRDAPRGGNDYDGRLQRHGDQGFHHNPPVYPSRGNRASSTSFRGSLNRGKPDYQSYKPSDDPMPNKNNPARHESGVPSRSESLNLKAGGQSRRSKSISADLP